MKLYYRRKYIYIYIYAYTTSTTSILLLKILLFEELPPRWKHWKIPWRKLEGGSTSYRDRFLRRENGVEVKFYRDEAPLESRDSSKDRIDCDLEGKRENGEKFRYWPRSILVPSSPRSSFRLVPIRHVHLRVLRIGFFSVIRDNDAPAILWLRDARPERRSPSFLKTIGCNLLPLEREIGRFLLETRIISPCLFFFFFVFNDWRIVSIN